MLLPWWTTSIEIFRAFATLIYPNFMKFIFLGFHVVVPVKTYHWCINYQFRSDMDETKVISALRQKSKFVFRTFKKKNQIFGFPWCSTREDLSIDVSITNVGLILTKLWRFLFSGTDRPTDKHGFGILIWKHVGTQKISTQSSKLVVSRRSLYASPEDGDA